MTTKKQEVASSRARDASREGDTASTRRAQHRNKAPERGAPEGQTKSDTTHHGTHRTDTPPILGGVCGVVVCVCVLPLTWQSWLGFVVLVFWCGLCPHPANPGSGLWCLCFGAGFAFSPLILAGMWAEAVFVRVLPVPRQSWLGLLVRVFQCRGLPSPCQSGLGFVVSVFGYGFCLHLAVSGLNL